jgi:hypothetical protein
MSNDNYGDGNNNSDDDDEYGAFLNRMHELRLMVRDLMLNPMPIHINNITDVEYDVV